MRVMVLREIGKKGSKRNMDVMKRGLEKARDLCGKHRAASLIAIIVVPELFLLAMGALCEAVPQLLAGSSVILAIAVALWAAGLALWAHSLVSQRRIGKHVNKVWGNRKKGADNEA